MEELIVKENNQKRLDSYVTDKLSKVSRTTAQRLIEEEKILVNGSKCKPSLKLKGGEEITIQKEEAKETPKTETKKEALIIRASFLGSSVYSHKNKLI